MYRKRGRSHGVYWHAQRPAGSGPRGISTKQHSADGPECSQCKLRGLGPTPRYKVTLPSQLIQREIVTHAQLHHENIIPLLGVFRESDSEPPMMVLPFMENGSASAYIAALADSDVATATTKIVRVVFDTASQLSPDSRTRRYVA